MSAPHVEHVEMTGHIVDSLLLPKVLDAILSRGGRYHIETLRLGERQDNPSFARLEVPAETSDCRTVAADMDGAFPDGFYCSTNFRTQVRLAGEWVDVEDQEMDCGIVVDPEGAAARCIPMTAVKTGDQILVGRQG